MINVPFPEPQFNIQTKEGKRYIFDGIRKAWLLLTEEEWVRQNIVAFFIGTLKYPKEAITLEKEIKVNGLKKRFDILVYNREQTPWMLVECKAGHITINEAVLQQALRYNLAVPVSFIVISNGAQTLVWEKMESRLQMADAFPEWPG